MGWKIVFYIFYGLLSGLAEIMPVSATAQGYVLTELTALQTRHPLMLMMMHCAILAVIIFQYRHRLGHMRRELQLEFQDSRRRKRQPDRNTVLDAKIVMFVSLPVIVMQLFSGMVYQRWAGLVLISIALTISGIAIYVPQFKPGANRDSRHLSPAEGLRLGFWSGLSIIPGISRMGMLLSCGLQRGCAKRYILDIAFLSAIPVLLVMILSDLIQLLVMGFAAIDGTLVLFSSLAAIAACFGAWLGMVVMRFLSLNASYSAFSYYCWGLAMFSFILYLMV